MPRAELTVTLGSRVTPVRFCEEGMEWVAAEIALKLPERPRLFIVADSRVFLLYESALASALRALGFEVFSVDFEPGEIHKNLRTTSRLVDRMTEERLTRDDVVIGLGGGVSTDLAGFAASIYQRGIRWIAVPTTLMGMADAAIGGKTGVDHPLGKNLIGTFHQPQAILAPLRVLDTLDRREWTSGSAEVVKAALLSGGELWADVLQYGPDLFTWPREKRLGAIGEAARVKMEIVEQDVKEGGLRRLLNLGHTFGHALEVATHYRPFRHGEAVILGLRATVRLSERRGRMQSDTAAEIDRVLSRAHTPGAELDSKDLLTALGHDKKIRSRTLHWILLRWPGQPYIEADLPAEQVSDAAEWLCELARAGGRSDSSANIRRVLIINGPNLNLLGEREPDIYGPGTYEDLESQLLDLAATEGAELLIRQSNIEGEIVSHIQRARHWADGIIINPGGYTHTSVAIRDALAAVTLPAIEVHLTEVANREDFRRVSLISQVCAETISGRGINGYVDAMRQIKILIANSARNTKPC